MASRRLAQPLLGCNVYISAGGSPRHAPILLDLLKTTQELCARIGPRGGGITGGPPLMTTKELEQERVCVVVHAFSDVAYNRSSIHLAANHEGLMATVVADLVHRTRSGLLVQEEHKDTTKSASSSVAHPSVGLVDHVSVMPLVDDDDDQGDNAKTDTNDKNGTYQPSTPSGRAARLIGTAMAETSNVTVFFYGDADPDQAPLAQVRRNKTNFFRSGGIATADDHDNQTLPPPTETATVGAPPNFVENFNIRLHCDKNLAQSLTRAVRERNGGIPGVEALTLPYSQGRFEVACNLLKPSVGSVERIQDKVDEWVAEALDTTGGTEQILETAYRVGTTADQCLQALESATHGVGSSRSQPLKQHNEHVWQQFNNYLSTS